MKLFAAVAAFILSTAPLAARTVTDELGRVVNLPDHPHRLICLAPNVVDDVYSIGAGADVVAVSDYTHYPVEASKKPSVGLPLNPSMETIVSLHPDLVLGSSDAKRSDTLNRLAQLHISVYMVNPRGIEGIYKSILDLGEVLGREQAARQVVANLKRRETAVRARVAGKPPVSVLMPIWYDPIMTIGKLAYISEMIEVAGGRSVTDDIVQEWPQVSLEAIIARAPDALLLERGSGVSLSVIQNRPGWRDLPAIRNHRVYYISGQIEYPSPVAFDALEDMARQLHP